jgi:hypothetical protein
VDYELFELVPMGMLGLLGGLLGASFNAASASLITLRSQLLPPDARFRVGEAVAVAFITSVVSSRESVCDIRSLWVSGFRSERAAESLSHGTDCFQNQT